jgi:hypothetical protein
MKRGMNQSDFLALHPNNEDSLPKDTRRAKDQRIDIIREHSINQSHGIDLCELRFCLSWSLN